MEVWKLSGGRERWRRVFHHVNGTKDARMKTAIDNDTFLPPENMGKQRRYQMQICFSNMEFPFVPED